MKLFQLILKVFIGWFYLNTYYSRLDGGSSETKIHYVFGDVMKPQLHGEKCAISVHCVG
jgi:hypothetical protein